MFDTTLLSLMPYFSDLYKFAFIRIVAINNILLKKVIDTTFSFPTLPMSSGSHGLETILQTLLATEKSTIQHLPNILQSLSYDPELISIPSNHRAKWMARVVSLLSSSKVIHTT